MGLELDWIANRARISPERIAVVDATKRTRWTYQELNHRAMNLASYLLELGVTKGDRIALLSPNHISYFDLLIACGKIGAIFVPLNWRLSETEISFILEDCTPVLLAKHSTFELRANVSTVEQVLWNDSKEYEAILTKNPTIHNNAELKDLDPLAIIYTGGTTGKPKGVVLTHQAIMWNGLNTILSWGLTTDDVTLTYLPMFHTGGLNALSIPILMMGGKVVIANDFDPDEAIQLINQEGCTVVLMVPTMYHMIVNCSTFQEAKFPTMQTFLSGGAPCPLDIYKAFEAKGLAFKEGYGLTEAGPNNFYIDSRLSRFRRGSVGKPMLFNEVKVITNEGQDAAPEEVGELLIKGKHVFHHYWNNQEATSSTLQNEWLYTGDLAKHDEEGFYYIVGRKKEMIITGGENVYPLEVEHCINQHPAINEVAVIGVPHPKWGETVVAIISLKQGEIVKKEDLIDFCRQSLGGYKIPRHIVVVDDIPKTHVGKINKGLLKNHYEDIVG